MICCALGSLAIKNIFINYGLLFSYFAFSIINFRNSEKSSLYIIFPGVCLAEFTGQSPFDKLKDHYYNKLTHKDFKNSFFKAGCPWLQESTECVACGRHFGHCCSLMQHMFDKSRRVDVEGDQHRMMTMKGVVEPICCKYFTKRFAFCGHWA
ncbi:hypothetical protein DPMN_079252 [Dreissena polymorpha]|uniref:Uncharacterized protein n=1 Tax=Dreissena polymorpha TaxID=45954 RepID=A0A9D3YQE9_DREPO|nr:hypothetical protein DPMN_079252 [Dreissena polymorpha]